MTAPPSSLVKPAPAALMRRFEGFDRLSVRQKKRWLEILLSFELKNAYDVFDGNQQAVLRAQEIGQGPGAFLARALLGPMRPFEVEVTDLVTGEVLLRLRRRFRFFFHRLEVCAGDGTYLGAIERRWSWVRRLYTVLGPEGGPVAELFGPVLRPWTFEVKVQGTAMGAIRKRWSGMAKELFTDADNFAVELGGLEPALRPLVFAATVLIDVVHFERAKG